MPLLVCPNDSASMQSVQRNGVEFDFCPTCRGVWLDRGELEKLMAASQDEPPPPPYEDRPRERETRPYQDERRYEDDRRERRSYRDDDDDRYRKDHGQPKQWRGADKVYKIGIDHIIRRLADGDHHFAAHREVIIV